MLLCGLWKNMSKDSEMQQVWCSEEWKEQQVGLDSKYCVWITLLLNMDLFFWKNKISLLKQHGIIL